MYGDERLARDCVGLTDDKPIKTTLSQWDSFVRTGIFGPETTLGQARDKIGIWNMSNEVRMSIWSEQETRRVSKTRAEIEREGREAFVAWHRRVDEEKARREAAIEKLMAEGRMK